MAAEQTIHIGEVFKQKRKERNLSLKEAENGTSIRMSYLKAIENGEINKLISPVYAEGFVRQYAIFLGIDGEAIIKENPAIFSHRIHQEFDYGIGTLEVRDNPSAGVKWLPNALWIGAFALLLIIAWYMARLLEVI